MAATNKRITISSTTGKPRHRLPEQSTAEVPTGPPSSPVDDHYRLLFDLSRDALVIGTPDGTPLDANQACLDLFGYSREEILALHITEIYANPTDRKRFTLALETESRLTDVELRLKKKDGTEMDCRCDFTVIRDDSGKPTIYYGSIRDNTREKMERKALEDSEARYHSLFSQSSEAISLVAPSGLLLDANKLYMDLMGYAEDDIGHVNVTDQYLNPASRESFLSHVRESDGPVYDETRLRTHDGRVIDCSRSVAVLRSEDGTVVGYQTVHRDITRSKQAAAALRKYREELQTLAHGIEQTREAERQGIARELHDEIGQALTVMKMGLARMAKGVEVGKPVAAVELHEQARIVDGVLSDVKRMSSDLRPGLLDDFGLVAAIEWHAREFQKRTGITCRVSASESLLPGQALSTALYRVCQELLTNVARHSHATRANVTFEHKRKVFVLVVRDNGVGIEPARVSGDGSLGLIGIRERLRPFRGRFKITGKPGAGTVATVNVPVDLEATAPEHDAGEN